MVDENKSATTSASACKMIGIAVVIVAVEAFVLLAIAIVGLFELSIDRVSIGIGVSLFFAAYACLLFFAAVKLFHGRRWARSPLILTQLILLGLAWSLRDENPPQLAGTMAVVALVGLGCLLAPSVTRVLFDAEAL